MSNDLSPADRMLIAIDKSDISPIISEIHNSPFLWFPAFIVLFFVFGNLFEILWIMFRDLRGFLFRVVRWPKQKIRDFGKNVRHKLRKRYGTKVREERKIWKKK